MSREILSTALAAAHQTGRGPQFKALVSGNVETCAVWRSPASESLYLMRQHSLYLETGEQLIRFTFYSQLNSSPAPEAQTEAIMKCQWSGSRVQGRYKLLTTWIMEWDN